MEWEIIGAGNAVLAILILILFKQLYDDDE